MTAAATPALPPAPGGGEASRRRQVPHSARSLLLTVLGEFVLPRRQPVWTAAFVDALGALGVEEKAARQALARTAAEGLIAPAKVGRRTRWELSSPGERLLAEGADRIYGFMREQHPWDGRWLVLAVTVPETQRQLRHRLRSRLTWAGLGSPAPGLWVVPHADRAEEVRRIVADLGVGHNAVSWVGESAGVGRPQDVVAAAWSLTDIEHDYEAFVHTFEHRRAEEPAEAFAAQVELVQSWRRFPAVDPALPAELLDHDWPGPRAATVFHHCHERWHRLAQAHWESLSAVADQGS